MTLWTTVHQASLSFTISESLLKLMSIESVMPSNHLIFCHSLLLLPSIFASIRVFSNELAVCTTWPKDWSFSFSVSPSSEHTGLGPSQRAVCHNRVTSACLGRAMEEVIYPVGFPGGGGFRIHGQRRALWGGPFILASLGI